MTPSPNTPNRQDWQFATDHLHIIQKVARRRAPYDADDVVQNATIRLAHIAAKKRRAGETINHPASFVRGVTKKVIQEYRRSQRRHDHTSLLDDLQPDDGDDLTQVIIRREEVTLILSSADPADAQLLEWKYLDGMTVKEIAAHTGQPVKTIRNRLKYARLRPRPRPRKLPRNSLRKNSTQLKHRGPDRDGQSGKRRRKHGRDH